jgi:uncharacterized protein (TIGR02996 family)
LIRKRFEGGSQFAEITWAERHVEVASGERLDVRDFETVRDAQFYVADTENRLRMLGQREVRAEEAYPSGVRDATLELALAAYPDDATGYLVYADWLQQQDDPRGELIVVQEALAKKPRDRALLAEQERLLEQHTDLLRGPLALVGPVGLEWFCGFVRAVDLGAWLATRGRSLLGPLLAHTSFAFLRVLAAQPHNDASLVQLAPLLPRTLERLELGVIARPDAIARAVAKVELPRLREIECNRARYRSVAEWLAAVTTPAGTDGAPPRAR